MSLFWLLLVPVLIGLGGLVFGKGRITWKEFLVHEGVVVLVVGVGYAIAYFSQTSDTEIWNGTVTSKTMDREQCCHSYSCDCHQVCHGSGKDRSCHTECDTCYRHGGRKTGWNGDVTWDAASSNGEHVYHDGCNPPGTSTPTRWQQIVIGEPTAAEHSYTNYIKANPDSVLVRRGIAAQFAGAIPTYPRVYDYYRASRFLAVGVTIPEAAALNARLSAINAQLGSPRQVNLTVIVTNVSDQMYLEALTEAWLGGKKNDLVVIVGAPEFPRIAWAGVMSWTRVEEVKLGIRDRIMDLGTFDGTKVLDIIASEVGEKFIRRPMADFEYLRATIEPPAWAEWTLFVLGLIIAAVLQVYFWKNDPFDAGVRYRYRYG